MCTVFSFLGYMSFKRKINDVRKKRHRQHVAAHSGHHSSEASRGTHTEERSRSKQKSPSTRMKQSNMYLHTPSGATQQAIESDHSSRYPSSRPSGSINISIMRKDQIHTPATSPVEPRPAFVDEDDADEFSAPESDDNSAIRDEEARDTVGSGHYDTETESYRSDDEYIGTYTTPQKGHKSRRGRGKEYHHPVDYHHHHGHDSQRRRDRHHYNGDEADEEPFEEEYNIYTNSLMDGEGDFEETELVEMQPKYHHVATGYGSRGYQHGSHGYPFRRGKPHRDDHHRPHKRHANQHSYEWIAKTLRRVDSQYVSGTPLLPSPCALRDVPPLLLFLHRFHEVYLENFVANKVQDHRLQDLLPRFCAVYIALEIVSVGAFVRLPSGGWTRCLHSDWRELIPKIGPRNEFIRVWRAQWDGNSARRHNGEYDYDDMAGSTAPDSELYSEYTEDVDGTSHTESGYYLKKMAAPTRDHKQDNNYVHEATAPIAAAADYDDFDDSMAHSAASPAGSVTTDAHEDIDVSSGYSSNMSQTDSHLKGGLSNQSSHRSDSYVSSEEEYTRKRKRHKKVERHRVRPPSPIEEVDESVETDDMEHFADSRHESSSGVSSQQQWRHLVGHTSKRQENHTPHSASALGAYGYDTTPHHGHMHRNLLVPTRSNRSNSSASNASTAQSVPQSVASSVSATSSTSY